MHALTPTPTTTTEPRIDLTLGAWELTLLGTAHVSRASAEAVRELAASGEFDAIAVELCQARYDALTAERKWTDLDLFRILREGKAGLVMANLALSAYQRRIAEQFGIEPGAEMRAAAVAAKAHNLPLQLVDRDLATTLRRSYASVPWYKRFYLMTGLALGDHLHFSVLVGGVFVQPTEWWDPHWVQDNVLLRFKEAGLPQPLPPAGK